MEGRKAGGCVGTRECGVSLINWGTSHVFSKGLTSEPGWRGALASQRRGPASAAAAVLLACLDLIAVLLKVGLTARHGGGAVSWEHLA